MGGFSSLRTSRPGDPVSFNPESNASRRLSATDETAQLELKRRVHDKLVAEIDPRKLAEMDAGRLRAAIEGAVEALLVSENLPFLRTMRQKLVADIADEVLGFGPLEPLLADPSVSEIMVNAADEKKPPPPERSCQCSLAGRGGRAGPGPNGVSHAAALAPGMSKQQDSMPKEPAKMEAIEEGGKPQNQAQKAPWSGTTREIWLGVGG